ncbi:MAG TPA: Hsp70 family protein, partial [Polyangium sp.]|nr:Hsp70 family protein [Polyangium sp.]
MNARHVVGIDLGTTHSALAYAEIGPEKPAVEPFPIMQLVARGALEERVLLPSFYYAAHESEGAQSLPWDKDRPFVVGEYARTRGIDAPNRLVSSAKSWLSHAGVDRRSALLPLGAPEDVEKISPVEASWRYLEHLAEAWTHKFGKERDLGAQEIVLTVPASFDAAARDLTVEAAGLAGFEDLTLLEEPQAALYAWID